MSYCCRLPWHLSSFENIHYVKDYVTFTGATGDVAVVFVVADWLGVTEGVVAGGVVDLTSYSKYEQTVFHSTTKLMFMFFYQNGL